MSTIGVPIKLLHEAQGHIVTCELKTGEIYRGSLVEAEDNMNCQMAQVSMTTRDGRVFALEQVYIRGSHVRLFIIPDALKNAPMFKKVGQAAKARAGAARGKSSAMRGQVKRGGRGGPGGPGRGGPGGPGRGGAPRGGR